VRLKNLKRLTLRGERHRRSPLKARKLFSILFTLLIPQFLFSDIYFGAKILRYLPDSKIIVLVDSAWTEDKNNRLKADSIIYFEDSSVIKAYGNATLITGKDSFFGDSLYYNTKLKTGFAFEGYTLREKGKIWGNMAYKDSLDNIYIKNGFYTTCDKDTPHYYFQAKYMKVEKRKMAIAKPVILKVHNVPLFIVPFWMFPVKEGRKSGFLTPHIGYNSYSGKYFRNLAYYFVINNYMDVTASVDIVENVGVRGNIDLVYKLYKHFGGEIKYSRAENFWPRRTEWSIKGWHSHILPWHTMLEARVDYVSSYDYYNQYSETRVEWLKKELYSYITLRRAFLPVPFTLTIDDRIRPDRKTRESLLPSFQYSLPPFSILNLRFSGGLLRKRVEDSLTTYIHEGIRNDVSMGYNNTLFHYIRLNTSFKSAFNILPKDTQNIRFTLQKSALLKESLSTTLYGFSIFGIPFAGIKKFVHILSPQIAFSYVPAIKNDSVVFQYGTLYSPGKQLLISLQNTFLAKTDSGKIPLFSLNLSTSYNFEAKKWNNVPITFSISEKLPVKIRGNVSYNTDKKALENPSLFASSSFKLPLPQTSFESTAHDTDSTIIHSITNSLSLNVNYSLTKTALFTSQTVSLSGGFKLSPSLSGSFATSYDLSKGKYLSKSISLKKDLHCWELTFSYNKYGNIWDYNFRIFIKKIPDIKIDKGFLKDLLP